MIFNKINYDFLTSIYSKNIVQAHKYYLDYGLKMENCINFLAATNNSKFTVF